MSSGVACRMDTSRLMKFLRMESLGYKKKAELALGWAGGTPAPTWFGVIYLFSESSLASFILADSSFFWTRATSFWSTSAATVLFHSEIARSQWAAASLRRPV